MFWAEMGTSLKKIGGVPSDHWTLVIYPFNLLPNFFKEYLNPKVSLNIVPIKHERPSWSLRITLNDYVVQITRFGKSHFINNKME